MILIKISKNDFFMNKATEIYPVNFNITQNSPSLPIDESTCSIATGWTYSCPWPETRLLRLASISNTNLIRPERVWLSSMPVIEACSLTVKGILWSGFGGETANATAKKYRTTTVYFMILVLSYEYAVRWQAFILQHFRLIRPLKRNSEQGSKGSSKASLFL